MTTAKNQRSSIKESGFGVIAQIEGNRIIAASIVNLLQAFITDRNKLRFIIGGTRRLGIPFHTTRPEDISFTLTHTVYIVFQLFVGVYRHMLNKVVIAFYCYEGMFSAVFCIFRLANKLAEHCPLQRFSLVLILLQSTLTRLEYVSYKSS